MSDSGWSRPVEGANAKRERRKQEIAEKKAARAFEQITESQERVAGSATVSTTRSDPRVAQHLYGNNNDDDSDEYAATSNNIAAGAVVGRYAVVGSRTKKHIDQRERARAQEASERAREAQAKRRAAAAAAAQSKDPSRFPSLAEKIACAGMDLVNSLDALHDEHADNDTLRIVYAIATAATALGAAIKKPDAADLELIWSCFSSESVEDNINKPAKTKQQQQQHRDDEGAAGLMLEVVDALMAHGRTAPGLATVVAALQTANIATALAKNEVGALFAAEAILRAAAPFAVADLHATLSLITGKKGDLIPKTGQQGKQMWHFLRWTWKSIVGGVGALNAKKKKCADEDEDNADDEADVINAAVAALSVGVTRVLNEISGLQKQGVSGLGDLVEEVAAAGGLAEIVVDRLDEISFPLASPLSDNRTGVRPVLMQPAAPLLLLRHPRAGDANVLARFFIFCGYHSSNFVKMCLVPMLRASSASETEITVLAALLQASADETTTAQAPIGADRLVFLSAPSAATSAGIEVTLSSILDRCANIEQTLSEEIEAALKQQQQNGSKKALLAALKKVNKIPLSATRRVPSPALAATVSRSSGGATAVATSSSSSSSSSSAAAAGAVDKSNSGTYAVPALRPPVRRGTDSDSSSWTFILSLLLLTAASAWVIYTVIYTPEKMLKKIPVVGDVLAMLRSKVQKLQFV